MDKDTFDIIAKMNDDQSRNFTKQLDDKEERDNLKFKGIQKSMDAGFSTLAVELRKLNGSIKSNRDDINELKKDTSWWRFFQRNTKSTLIFVLIFAVGAVVLTGTYINNETFRLAINKLKFW